MLGKNIRDIISDLGEIVRTLSYLALFFYISQIIWPYINLPYSNPEGMLGYLSKLEFNPLNNTFRYFISLVVILGGFILISRLSKSNQKRVMRVIFILTLVISYFLTAFVRPDNKYFLDIFHDGIQIGSAALHLQGRSLYTENVLMHGPFNDPLIAVSSFWLFGKSIGSFLLMTALMRLISFTLFFLLLTVVIKSDLIFYLASVWFYNLVTMSIDFQKLNFVVSTIRDTNVWLMLLLLWFLAKKEWKTRFLLFSVGFLGGFQYFISLDRAYILSIFTFILFLYLLIVKRVGVRRTLPLIGGVLVGFLIQIPLMGLSSFLEFLNFAFRDYPRLAMFTNVFIFPSFAESPNSWMPILMIIFSGVFIFRRFLSPSFKNRSYILLVFIFSVIFFINGINTNDPYHLFYGSTVAFLVGFLILDNVYLTTTDESTDSAYVFWKNLTGIFIIIYFLFNYNVPNLDLRTVKPYQKMYYFRRADCYIDKEDNRDQRFQSFIDYYLLNHLRCPPNRNLDDIKNFFTINNKSDTEWIPEDANEVVNYINSQTTEDDYVFIFTNEAGYYYFLKAKSPTRFSIVLFAASKKYADELFNEVQSNPPKLVLYSTSSWPETVAGMTVQERFPELNKWLLENYPQKIKIKYATILAKEGTVDVPDAIPTPTSTPSATPKPK